MEGERLEGGGQLYGVAVGSRIFCPPNNAKVRNNYFSPLSLSLCACVLVHACFYLFFFNKGDLCVACMRLFVIQTNLLLCLLFLSLFLCFCLSFFMSVSRCFELNVKFKQYIVIKTVLMRSTQFCYQAKSFSIVILLCKSFIEFIKRCNRSGAIQILL
jgi:hypothetical protein